MKIFWDVDTQNDFMNPNGKLYVPNAEIIKPNLKILTDYAREKNISVLGSVDKHFGTEEYRDREGELQKWGGPFPDHCMDGTYGQEKIADTRIKEWKDRDARYMDEGHRIPNWYREGDKIPEFLIDSFVNLSNGERGLYFEKQSFDVFDNPIVEKVLERAEVKEAVVYGVATDYCVKAAVLGMQKRGIQTYVVEDAIMGVAEDTTKSALEEMTNAGAIFLKTTDIVKNSGGRR